MTEEPSALQRAVSDLAGLIATGPAPDRVIEAVGTVVAGWADEPDLGAEAVLARVEQLWDGFSTDAAHLQEQLADTEGGDPATLARGRRVLAATEAAVATLAAISSR